MSFVRKYCTGRGHTNCPIPGGYNQNGFDKHIIQTLAKRYGQVDKDGIQTLFNRQYSFDVKDLMCFYAEGTDIFRDLKLDTVRRVMGLSSEGAHDALVDTNQTASLLVRFLELHRHFTAKNYFQDSFKRRPDTKGFL